MSLGFLTESALVPSKAKEIKVDAKSLVDLKAVVFQKDQERKRRLQDALTAANDEAVLRGPKACRFGKYAHLRGRRTDHKRSEEDPVGGKNYCNSGVEARSRRDEEAKASEAPDEHDDAAWRTLSAEMLRKKAQLYEKLAHGIGTDHVNGECLVDFGAKRAMASRGVTTTAAEIMDEFGRTRSVATDSEEYATFLEAQATHQGLYEETLGKRNRFDNDESRGEEANVNGGSFVVSQWEKCLKSTEKTHLKEVHERATLLQSLAQSSTTGAAGKKTRKQVRLERLRNQREEVATSSETAAAANAAVDSAASEQAADFLQQFSPFM